MPIGSTALDASWLLAVLSAFPNGSVSVFDRDLRYVFSAGQGLSAVGLSTEKLTGHRLQDVFDHTLVESVTPYYHRAFDGEQVQFDFTAFGKTYHVSAAPVPDSGGSIAHIVVVTQDISGRKEHETALRSSEEALRAQDRRKDAFISTLAHEMRQPLAAMAAAVDVLKRQHPAVADTRPLAILDRQVMHVRHLMDDLVDASRLAMGRVTLSREVLDLRRVVRSALDTVVPAIDSRQQQVMLTAPEEPVKVDGDRTRLQQVFSNLLNNASKYGRVGGSVWVEMSCDRETAVVAVRDNGIGIGAEALPHIFDLFTQASDQDRGGVGIGLSVVRSLVSAHRGTIEARSPGIGEGSTFIVRLPAYVF